MMMCLEEIVSCEPDLRDFEDQFDRCRNLLQLVAVRILGSQEYGKVAVRNCQTAASRNPPSFESEGAFRSWLVRILIDEAVELL
jgi:DNA-directed RNA polymerase specialized sigma24 family protein